MFDLRPSRLKGCFELQPRVIQDERGRFVKVFEQRAFAAQELETNFIEDYYSISHKNVIRGLHFQLPPLDHVKLVYCVEGTVMDVVVDLRYGSPTYAQYEAFELSADKANGIYIPKGMAHGFCSLVEHSILMYKVSTIYSPSHDAGVLWNSASIPWPTTTPILSQRDQKFPPLARFESPFRYE